MQYRWCATRAGQQLLPDHVNAIHTCGHGMVGQLIVEPTGTTWTDPATGKAVSSGAMVDIHTTNPLVPNLRPCPRCQRKPHGASAAGLHHTWTLTAPNPGIKPDGPVSLT